MEIPPGFAQINLVFNGLAVPRGAQCVYGVLVTSGGVNTTPAQVAQVAANAFSVDLAQRVVNNITLKEVKVKFGPNTTGPDHTLTAGIQGQQNSSGDAPQVAVLIRKVTPFGGRQGKGRMFLPGLAEAVTDTGGTLQGQYRVDLQQDMTDWLTFHDNAGLPVQLLHAEAGLAPFVVTAMEVQSLVATQRRRLRKVGGRRRVV
jgi:hypothetical protein